MTISSSSSDDNGNSDHDKALNENIITLDVSSTEESIVDNNN